MERAIEEYIKGDIIGRVYYDEDAPNPRTEWDNIGTIVTRRDFGFSDEVGGSYRDSIGHVSRPVYMLQHSGTSVSTVDFEDPWDSGCIGAIYCSLEKARETWSLPEAEWDTIVNGTSFRTVVGAALEAEISTLNDYLNGNCYRYTVSRVKPLFYADGTPSGKVDEDILDSCGGYLGDEKYAIEEMKASVEHHAEKENQ